MRERHVRMSLEHRGEHASQWACIKSIDGTIGCTAQTLDNRVKQHERDSGVSDGIATAKAQRVRELERENRELRKTKEILKLASAFFARAEPHRRWN
ncbi:hypothetical protein EV685_0472 [Sphaerotilus mobilis]|uniref:Transposase n=1 Tax=Sphaerotilus mobilis TaxID=47994 RepID=A0A4Q7LUV4_9BURK|nr:hypothetical protein EV685_0472 [Sphaerotilus mobilis]